MTTYHVPDQARHMFFPPPGKTIVLSTKAHLWPLGSRPTAHQWLPSAPRSIPSSFQELSLFTLKVP